MISSVESVPRLNGLPISLPRESAVEIEVEQGILIFRASKIAQDRIEQLLNKQKKTKLDGSEEKELNQYEDIDDYLSFLNRLTRNLAESQPEDLPSGS
ncbi:MAG: hypothetical protein M3388_09370 [Acidobacteriota bacterium]|nr:hypothetical protein [Acidobacteriota bacterium]